MTAFRVFYMRPDHIRDFILGFKLPTVAGLEETHVHLLDREAERLEDVWVIQQAEQWSPNGEARPLIERKGLRHTSMSVGDVVQDGANYYAVGTFGFKEII